LHVLGELVALPITSPTSVQLSTHLPLEEMYP
jgi:hypothetical protein